jgi:hypothetical protein
MDVYATIDERHQKRDSGDQHPPTLSSFLSPFLSFYQ